MWSAPEPSTNPQLSRNAIASANEVIHEVENLNARAGIVAALIGEVDEHTAAYLAAVLEQGGGQGPDLIQREVGAFGKHANATVRVVEYVVEPDAANVIATVVDRPR